jgi:hypothetical protein
LGFRKTLSGAIRLNSILFSWVAQMMTQAAQTEKIWRENYLSGKRRITALSMGETQQQGKSVATAAPN